MKKNLILILVLTLLVCGCGDKSSEKKGNNEQEVNTLTKEQVFKEEAIEIYRDFQLTHENIGYYVTPLSSFLNSTTGYEELFNGCDLKDTHIAYEIREGADGIESRLRLIFKCNGISETYLYDSLYDEEPIIY